MNRFLLNVVIGLITALFLASAAQAQSPANAPPIGRPSSTEQQSPPLTVAIVGSDVTNALRTRILLSDDTVAVDKTNADVYWVIGTIPSAQWSDILNKVRRGAGLIWIRGGKTTQPLPDDLANLGLPVASTVGRTNKRPADLSATYATRRTTVGTPPLPSALRVFSEEVIWSTAPQVAARQRFLKPLPGKLTPLLYEKETLAPLALAGDWGKGRVVLLGINLGAPSNRQLTLWTYFNYFLYALNHWTATRSVTPFMHWSKAPVPGPQTRTVLVIGICIAWFITLFIFLRVRRYSRRHPEIPERFFQSLARHNQRTRHNQRARHDQRKKPQRPSDAPINKSDRQENEPATATESSSQSGGWQEIGFSRSLAGFLTLVATLFILFAPYYYVTNVLIPNHVQPFPQSKGIWGFVWEALQIAWFLFDAGTYVAFVKYFAEFRIKSPKQAVLSAQFFVWWQILTGLVQVTMASVVALFILPHLPGARPYGYTSTFILLVVLGQYPGIFGVMNFFFQAYQRYDYNIGLDLLADWVLRFALQIPFVLIFRAWGAAHPAYGEAFGATVGIGLGFYFSQVVTFFVGTMLYKRLGLRLTPLFMAHFDGETAKRMLKYGMQVVLGKAFFRAAKFIDRFVISLLLLNYTEWLGIEDQIHYNLMFLFPIAYRFFETAMAALSESHGNGKKTLTQYYVVRFFQVGSLYTAIALSLFMALGASFVRHAMDPQWARAADFMVIAAIAGAFSAAAWISDMLQKGAGRPDLFAYVLGGEQVLRIGLFWLLIPRFQFWGFYWALLSTIALKVVVAWTINHWVILRVRLYLWPMFAAPALAGLFNYALLRGIDAVLGFSSRLEVIIFFFASALFSFFSCFFATGLCGGFDKQFSKELQRASAMTGVLKPLTRLFYLAAEGGRRLSPLRDRFNVTIASLAHQEAIELEKARDTSSKSEQT